MSSTLPNTAVQAVSFIGLAAIKGDAVDVLVYPHERETKIRLSRIVLGVEVDQRTADAPAHVGSSARVNQRAPDEIAGRSEVAASDRQKLALREPPKDADEREQKKARLQKADAQVGGEIGQMLGVGLEALIGVGAERARIRQAERALGLEPLVQEIVHQALAQDDLGALVEPHLRHVEDQQYARDLAEDAKLRQEAGHVLVGQRIVEWAVPGIEPDLHVGRGPDDNDQRAGQAPGACCAGAKPRTPKPSK